MKKYFIIFAIIIFALSFNIAQGQESRKAVVLDEETLEKGYTLSDDNFSLGIQPQTFYDPAKIYFRKIDLEKKKIELPENLNLISSVYLYNVGVPDQSVLNKVIWLSLDYNSESKYQKDLYFYNGVNNEWQKLLSRNDENNSKILSGWWFPYSIVAVFENPDELEGPSKASGYSDFWYTPDAAAAIVIDEDTGKVLYKKNSNQKRSIASLTKIMTALIFLETNTSMDKVISYNSANNTIGASLNVSHGETMTAKDIFYCMLVGSGNNCALTLADATGLSRNDFVIRMNNKAKDLQLNDTVFADPSGLNVGNISTVSDYAKLMQVALDEYEIMKASTTNNYIFYTINKNVYHSINNTSKNLNWGSLYFTGAKTGYLDEALYCQMVKIKQNNHEIITVLLGNYSSTDRFQETYDLSKWALENYSWN